VQENEKHMRVDFIGIGSGKCATTWAYTCLLEHPQISGPDVKELNFFVTEKNTISERDFEHYKLFYNKGIESYLERFKRCPSDSVKGEISVAYLTDSGAAELIKKYFPDVKILVFLRDPVERAYSSYWFTSKFIGKEKNETFQEALKKKDGYDFYIDRGMYYKHLKKYYDIFPKENIGVFWVDDLKKDPVRFIQDVYKFLGVDSNFVPPSVRKRANTAREVRWKFLKMTVDYTVDKFYVFLKFTRFHFIKDLSIKIGLQKLIFYIFYEVNVRPFKKPPLDPLTEIMLRRLFLEDIENLEKLTGRDLSPWKRNV
jgi:hypothetical protein